MPGGDAQYHCASSLEADMAELHRKATDEDLRFARKPLTDIDPKRVEAYRKRYRAIEKLFDQQVRDTFQRTKTGRDRHSSEASRAMEAERDRKLEQLKEEFLLMVDPSLFEAAKKAWTDFSASSPYKGLKYLNEAKGYAETAASFAATGLAMTNPVTATLAILNELDKWIGRAIGWVQMARKQWDADCSRISSRIATSIKAYHGDSKLESARTGAGKSTLTRQRLERLLYKKVLEVREETIKYKIRECEITAEAQKILGEKKRVELQAAAAEAQLKQVQRLPVGIYDKDQVVTARRKHEKLVKDCMELNEKVMDLLNEVVDNCHKLVNKAQQDVEKMVAECVASFAHTEALGKFAGTHTDGAWRAKFR